MLIDIPSYRFSLMIVGNGSTDVLSFTYLKEAETAYDNIRGTSRYLSGDQQIKVARLYPIPLPNAMELG